MRNNARLVQAAMGLLALGGLCLAEPLPEAKKDRVRGSLDGYELLQVHAQLRFPDTVPAPIEIDWKLGPDMPLPVKGGVAGVLNEHLVIVPGIGFREFDHVVQALDLKTMKWAGLPRIPKPPLYTAGAWARDSILVLSGRGNVAPEVGRSVQRLRFVEGSWVWDELPPLPGKIWYGSSACVDGRWLAIANGDIGRGVGPDQISRDVWVLDLDHLEEGWETVARYEHGVMQPLLGGVRGKVYVFGGSRFYPPLREEATKLLAKGMRYWSNGDLRQKFVYALDLKSRQWTRCADMPYSRSGGVALAYGDRYILLFGGSNLSRDLESVRPGKSRSHDAKETFNHWKGHHDQVLVYDTVRDAWSVLSRPMPYGVNNPQATIHGETVYVAGGEPDHWYNRNTEDVVMIGTIGPAKKLNREKP